MNAVHWQMFEEMAPAFEALLARPEVRVVVVASALERHFSSGADLAVFDRIDVAGMTEWVRRAHQLVRLMRASPKPILAAINGIAVGGGLEISLHADLRFAAENARFGQPEVNIAFIPPVGGTQGLVRLLGRSAAFGMLYEGEMIDAATAHEIGLVDRIVPPERLRDEVQDYAERLAAKPANALAAIRRCLVDGGSLPFEDGLKVEFDAVVALAEHPNFAEGVSAFLQKRPPDWKP